MELWDFFSAVKLSVVVLLTLALTSIIGTLVPLKDTFLTSEIIDI